MDLKLQSFRNDKIMKKVSDTFDVFIASSMSDFYVILQFLATVTVIK